MDLNFYYLPLVKVEEVPFRNPPNIDHFEKPRFPTWLKIVKVDSANNATATIIQCIKIRCFESFVDKIWFYPGA